MKAVLKPVLWITTVVFGSLFGLAAGLLFGAIFAMGMTGLTPDIVAKRVIENVFTADATARAVAARTVPVVQTASPSANPKFETAAAR
jgi:hypothetical protein